MLSDVSKTLHTVLWKNFSDMIDGQERRNVRGESFL